MNTSLSVVRQQQINRGVKLGKAAPRRDPRTLKLSDYISTVTMPPAQAGYISEVPSWPMYLNDAIGDCVEAEQGHSIQQWTTYAGKPFTPTDAQILDAYEAITGYNPNNPRSDQGTVILDALRFWRKSGVAGHKIVAFVQVNFHNQSEIKQSVQLFGNCMIGIQLPITAQRPITGVNGYPCWPVPSSLTGDGAPGSWGGHCIPIMGYGIDPDGNAGVEVITWGQIYDATWKFLDAYVDEAWAIVTEDWIQQDGLSPSGFNLAQLRQDLATVTA